VGKIISCDEGLISSARAAWERCTASRILVSRSINTMMFANGACEGRSRSEEKVMQGHRRRRVTRKRVPRDRPQPPSARRVAAGRHRFLCRSSSTMSLTSRRRRFVNSTPSRSPQTSPYLWSGTLNSRREMNNIMTLPLLHRPEKQLHGTQ